MVDRKKSKRDEDALVAEIRAKLVRERAAAAERRAIKKAKHDASLKPKAAPRHGRHGFKEGGGRFS